MHDLRFRQIHLDFHTSEKIADIGSAFDKKQWQETLKKAHVNSVTTFATCHHGWAYYDTKVGTRHPHLSFDLLRAQFDASKEIDVNVPIYLTAGVNNMAMVAHPEWRQIGPDGHLTGWASSNLQAGFFRACFNTGYLDFLCNQIREVVTLFPNCDGIFLDIISQPPCVCHSCIASMEAQDLDPLNEDDRRRHSRKTLLKYYRQTTAAARIDDPRMPIFHNSGHITQGDTEILDFFSHLELESLPTGGWGYDHFPMSAKYCVNLPHDFLGMTGKFHTTWGEFGGFKHPNALRYECAQMLAVGSKCSIGDQLHPLGRLDENTYEIIGAAYGEVAAKEAWCDRAIRVADIGLFSTASMSRGDGVESREEPADVGAGRIMLEGHFLFDVVDENMDFSGRKALVLPDTVRITPSLKNKLDTFMAGGGKLILSGESVLLSDDTGYAWDIGATYEGLSEFQPDYILPVDGIRPDFVSSPLVMYLNSTRLQVTDGESLGAVHDPYFNRTYEHFSSHQHAPNRSMSSGFDCGVIKNNILCFAHPVFAIYRTYGAVAYRQYVTNAILHFLGDSLSMYTKNMPSTARVHVADQTDESRYVVHLLWANTVLRGGSVEMHGGTVRSTKPVEVVEELVPLRNSCVSMNLPRKVKKVTLEPQGLEIPFTVVGGRLQIEVDEFVCHQMVVLDYD